MLNSRQDSDDRRQSNFVRTCNLLGRFVKRKGSLRDLNLEIEGKVENLETIVNQRLRYAASASPPAAINSIRDVKKSAQPAEESHPSSDPFPIDINAEYVPTSPSREMPTKKLKTAPLTMFYGGRVLIFNDYPADRAKELVAMAKKGTSQMSYAIFSNNFLPEKDKPKPSPAAVASTSSPREGLPPRPQANSSRKHSVIPSNTCKDIMKADIIAAVASSSKEKETLSPQLEAAGSDMPIARRSSLHRFLEKRKDRAGGRVLFQIPEQAAAPSSSKEDEQLELKL